MIYALSQAFYSLEISNPNLFYLFLGLLYLGVILFYFYRHEYGLISTFILAAILYYSDVLTLINEIIMIASLVILILSFIGFRTIIDEINNFINGIILYYKYYRKHR